MVRPSAGPVDVEPMPMKWNYSIVFTIEDNDADGPDGIGGPEGDGWVNTESQTLVEYGTVPEEYVEAGNKPGGMKKFVNFLDEKRFREFLEEYDLEFECDTLGTIGVPPFGICHVPALSFSSEGSAVCYNAYITPWVRTRSGRFDRGRTNRWIGRKLDKMKEGDPNDREPVIFRWESDGKQETDFRGDSPIDGFSRITKPESPTERGDVVAIFPQIPSTPIRSECLCYAHVGQHSSCDPVHVMKNSRKATERQYSKLKRELTGRGYVLKVVDRYTSTHSRNRVKALREMG